MGLLTGGLLSAAADVHDWSDAVTALGAVIAAYILSDLGTAVYHWVSLTAALYPNLC